MELHAKLGGTFISELHSYFEKAFLGLVFAFSFSIVWFMYADNQKKKRVSGFPYKKPFSKPNWCFFFPFSTIDLSATRDNVLNFSYQSNSRSITPIDVTHISDIFFSTSYLSDGQTAYEVLTLNSSCLKIQ